MNVNRITDVTKIIIFAATIVVVCVMVALGFKIVNEGKASITNGTSQYNDMAAEYSDVKLASYDNSDVLGSEVRNVILKQIEKKTSVTITVKTLAGAGVTYNATPGATPTPPLTATSVEYINPTASFTGKLTKNANGVITNVTFTQK